MSKPVLFVTGLGKEVQRAENLYALYEAYQGEKKIMSMQDENYISEVNSGKYGLVIVDIFPTFKTGKCIMMWHAIQGGKYIGLDEKTTYYRESYADLMERIIVAGRGGIDMFHQCTKVPKERILNLGMPRTDRYFHRFKGKTHPIFNGKRVYLFVPTFRNWRETAMPMIDWKWIDMQLTDDEILVVKAHPYGHDFDIGGCKHIIQANKIEPSVTYLHDADVVITDYSSIMFDAYLMNKPVVLFEKNPGYVNTRGMYLKYPDEYCSRYATNEKELLELMRSAKRLRKTEKACRDYVADMCDGHSCERICKLIEEMNT